MKLRRRSPTTAEPLAGTLWREPIKLSAIPQPVLMEFSSTAYPYLESDCAFAPSPPTSAVDLSFGDVVSETGVFTPEALLLEADFVARLMSGLTGSDLVVQPVVCQYTHDVLIGVGEEWAAVEAKSFAKGVAVGQEWNAAEVATFHTEQSWCWRAREQADQVLEVDGAMFDAMDADQAALEQEYQSAMDEERIAFTLVRDD